MEDDENQNAAVFRGRFKDCLTHLFADFETRAPRGTRESVAIRRPVADFCGVKEASVARWMRGENEVIGEVYFRLVCYLQLIGYEVIEVVRSDVVIRGTIELIGFRILSGEEISKAIGYTTSSSLFQVLHGHVGLGEDKKTTLWNVGKKYRNALEEAKKKVQNAIKSSSRQERIHARISDYNTDTPEKQKTQKAEPHLPIGISQGVLSIMAGLLILLEKGMLTEESCTALGPQEQRTVLKLSGHLSRLSSSLVANGIGRGEEP